MERSLQKWEWGGVQVVRVAVTEKRAQYLLHAKADGGGREMGFTRGGINLKRKGTKCRKGGEQ